MSEDNPFADPAVSAAGGGHAAPAGGGVGVGAAGGASYEQQPPWLAPSSGYDAYAPPAAPPAAPAEWGAPPSYAAPPPAMPPPPPPNEWSLPPPSAVPTGSSAFNYNPPAARAPAAAAAPPPSAAEIAQSDKNLIIYMRLANVRRFFRGRSRPIPTPRSLPPSQVAVSILIGAAAVVSLLSLSGGFAGIVVCAYVFSFSCLLCCFETHLKAISRVIGENFGFMCASEREPRARQARPARPRFCLLYTSPSPRDGLLSRMPSSA